jgi:molybdenum cofactor cytidylyltransferase
MGASAWVSAILLAAGESRRMGEPKQLLAWGGTTLLGQAIDILLGSEVVEVIVVLGYKAKEMAQEIAGRPVKVVINPRYELGMSSSLICGLNSVDERAEGVMVALGDQPSISSETITRLIKVFSSKQGIVAPVYKGIRGHPLIFATKYREELLALRGDVGGRQIIETHPEDIWEVEVESPGVISDIDDQEDYRAAN